MKQTRQNVCGCVVACRAAALKIKTSSRIKRFQKPKDYGGQFNKLIQYNTSPIISRNDFSYKVSVNNTSLSSSPCVNDERLRGVV